jgi:hypothetical protein
MEDIFYTQERAKHQRPPDQIRIRQDKRIRFIEQTIKAFLVRDQRKDIRLTPCELRLHLGEKVWEQQLPRT